MKSALAKATISKFRLYIKVSGLILLLLGLITLGLLLSLQNTSVILILIAAALALLGLILAASPEALTIALEGIFLLP
jgi:hypothetical protein